MSLFRREKELFDVFTHEAAFEADWLNTFANKNLHIIDYNHPQTMYACANTKQIKPKNGCF